ncbi:PLP-dependent aminotransferase family protein [Citrobacter rodentium]|jgi:Transcriptional regulators containing a DNA-binding HTH domain and an aminotransferase domain (MocR family) and their eukaryotic orthologs|uniref:Aminotransferase n=2 Tax=Citrobacter rodentium TaxID=67825 RepID=D2TRM3_CITRI|nr:PLP-dependent aminotransferase family protein [Citrobacter rodentium]KIQ49837.1 GntR family transcriptional regulator [Citrobacter rodentium]QBY29927.1 PLP-dependent aminotransferase family protein [Citrobacter rodentium]UHO32685.1 PLP-dependent aminotransferase family protein [Citrobacter rodentium NBRC 105723 = DSM 16636]CBG90282.1 putative aminotransferase [Citrobacter rodentium ICC168]HAT8014271.1 PLP-dependent aminotransferase family protein [Citrobacter rodentium NBRC 105723 = DSM 166
MNNTHLARNVDALKPSAIRELLKHSKMPGVISLGGGIPSPELFDKTGLELATHQMMENQFLDAFQYGLSEGFPPLREAISQLCRERGVDCAADRILITNGSQQSLDILVRTLVNPGDKVVVERPTYLAALQVLQLSQADILSVGTDKDGMIVDELEQLLQRHTIKALYVVPTFGNPGGVVLSEARRRKLVQLAKQHDFVIIEDDPYGEINFTDQHWKPLFRHAAEAGCAGHVIYTSTFSKILAPGLRVGWVVLPEWISQKATIVKQATDLHTSAHSQAMAASYLSLGRLAEQITLIRQAYREKCYVLADMMRSELDEHITFHMPQGGMFLWATFRHDFDATAWLSRTLEEKVVYVPGEFFYSDNPDKRTLRLSFATPTMAELEEAVRRLKRALP